MNFIIIGMKHCGKTTVGRALAEQKKMQFLDSDLLLEQRFLDFNGERLSCREIFKNYGEKYFRDLEFTVLSDLAARKQRNTVIALGGGCVGSERMKELTKSLGCVVYLQTAPDIIFKRILRRGLPPFLDTEDPRKSFDEMYETRRYDYERIADVKVDITQELPVDKVVEQIELSLKESQI